MNFCICCCQLYYVMMLNDKSLIHFESTARLQIYIQSAPTFLQPAGRVRCLFQRFWTERLWPSAGAYAVMEQSGSYTPRAFLQDDGTSRRERQSCPVWICDQTGSSHNQLTGQAATAISNSHSSPAAKSLDHSQLQCLHHC